MSGLNEEEVAKFKEHWQAEGKTAPKKEKQKEVPPQKENVESAPEPEEEVPSTPEKELALTVPITVGDLAKKINLKPNELIKA